MPEAFSSVQPPLSQRLQRLRRHVSPLAAAACLALAAVPVTLRAQAAAPATAAAPAPTVRPEAVKLLAPAQELLKAGKHTEALAKLAEAEALPGLTPYESYLTRRMKAPALYSTGNAAGALPVFEGLIDDPQLPPAERMLMVDTTIKLAVQQKDFPRAAKWLKVYFANGGTDAELKKLYPQVLSLVGDHTGAAEGYRAQVAAEEAGGKPASEATLRLLASSQGQTKDEAGYLVTLEKLAGSTGKADYWNELIARVTRADGFAAERLRLDTYRLRQAVGLKLSAGEVGDMALRANQAGLPAEAQKLLDDGFASNLLGNDANATADKQLRAQATKAAAQDRAGAADSEAALRNAKDGNAAYGLGMALSGAGMHDKALALMAQGQAKGGLRRPDDAMLHLGLVQWRAGKAEEALKTFSAVGGKDGPAELARLWALYLNSPARK